MLQEAPQKLFGRECHDAWPAAVRVVPAETHFGIRDREQAVVGDGDAMSVAGQIVKDVFRSTEGRLGVDNPVLLEQGVVRYRVCKAGWKREAVKNSESDIDVFGKNQITQEDNRRVAYYH